MIRFLLALILSMPLVYGVANTNYPSVLGTPVVPVTNGYATNAIINGVINVMHSAYGAKGDGTTDDTTAIQNALNAATSREVLIPPGNYKLTSALTTQTNTIIRGYGARLFTSVAANRIITLNSGCKIYGLELEGPGNGTYGDTGRAVSVEGTVGAYKFNVLIQDLYIHGMAGYGIRMDFATNVIVFRNRIEHIGYAAIMGLSAEDVTVDLNLIDEISPGTAGNAYGISVTRQSSTNLVTVPRSARWKIHSNTIKNIPLWEGIDTHGSDDISILNNEIYGCKVGIAAVASLVVLGTDGYAPLNTRIICNFIKGLGTGYGISFGGAFGTTGNPVQYATGAIVGNTLTNCGEAGNNISGAIYLHETQGVTVSGGTLDGSRANGINVNNDNRNYAITGVTINDTWDNSYTVPSAITMRSQFNKGVISGNTLTRNNTSLGTFVSIRGISDSFPADNVTTLGDNEITCTDPYTGVFPSVYKVDGDGSTAFLRVDRGNNNVALGTPLTTYRLSVRQDQASLANLISGENRTAAGAANIQVYADSASGGLRAYSSTYSDGYRQDKVGLSVESTATALILDAPNSGQTVDVYSGGTTRSGQWTSTNVIVTGNGFLNGITVTNIGASKLVRTDANRALAAVTIGSGVAFDGTTLTGTGNWDPTGVSTDSGRIKFLPVTLTTTDATPTSLLSLTLASGQTYFIELKVVTYLNGFGGRGYTFKQQFSVLYTGSGDADIAPNPASPEMYKNRDATSAAASDFVSVSTSGATFSVTFTGVAATTFNTSGLLTYFRTEP